jgi:hypothetical protein
VKLNEAAFLDEQPSTSTAAAPTAEAGTVRSDRRPARRSRAARLQSLAAAEGSDEDTATTTTAAG